MSQVIHCRVFFQQVGRRRVLRTAEEGPIQVGRIPRVSRFLALAIRLDELVRRGHAPNYSALARLGGVSTPRLSHLMILTLLAPDIQEEILIWPPVTRGRDPITENDLRPITCEPDWRDQRRLWKRLIEKLGELKSRSHRTSISSAKPA